MYEISKERFGVFVASRRRLLGMTQAELAAQLHISNKAVSKWETGVSLPDVSMLIPLSEALGVTVTELLQGQAHTLEAPMDSSSVEELVQTALHYPEGRRPQVKTYILCLLLSLLEGLAIHLFVAPVWEWTTFVYLSYLFGMGFGAYFYLLVRPLPAYYDRNRIQGIYQGIFRMNVPGLYFTNRNWPHIVRVCRRWSMGLLIGYPLVYALMTRLHPDAWLRLEPGLVLATVVPGLLIPIYVVGKKYG